MSTEASRAATRAGPVEDGTGSFGTAEFLLYALTLATWSTGWIGIKLQVGSVPIWQSVFYRFAIAATVMFIWVFVSGRRVRFPLRLHLRFLAMGALMFSSNFVTMYFAAQYLTSGLLAVVFSLTTVINPINAALFLGQRMQKKALLGALIGITGIALIYWPEVNRPGSGGLALLGLASAITGTLCFSFGNIVAFRVYREGLPVISTNAWGMFYGVILLGLLVAVIGEPLTIETSALYLSVLFILGTVTTVLPMASYLTLVRRIGPSRAGYATVMFPIGALAISWAFEGYEWTVVALAGLALALLGNIFVLGKPRST